MAIESIERGQSDTLKNLIGLIVTQVVNLTANLGMLAGHPLTAEMQLTLTNTLLAASTLVSLYFAWRAYVGRLNTNTVIAGSKGEQAMIEKGVEIVPKQPEPPCKNPPEGG